MFGTNPWHLMETVLREHLHDWMPNLLLGRFALRVIGGKQTADMDPRLILICVWVGLHHEVDEEAALHICRLLSAKRRLQRGCGLCRPAFLPLNLFHARGECRRRISRLLVTRLLPLWNAKDIFCSVSVNLTVQKLAWLSPSCHCCLGVHLSKLVITCINLQAFESHRTYSLNPGVGTIIMTEWPLRSNDDESVLALMQLSEDSVNGGRMSRRQVYAACNTRA